MPPAAPRIDARLVAAVERVDRAGIPIAETHRRVGRIAEAIGVPRPSYEQIRVIVHEFRSERLEASLGRLLVDVTLSTQTKAAILRAIEGAA